MRTRLVAAVSLALVGSACGCFRQPAVQVVDLAAGKLPPGEEVELDGGVADPVWGRAASMPFEKTGEARFLWNERRLYGSVGKWEKRFGFASGEQICVEVRAEKQMVRLCFDQTVSQSGVLALCGAWRLEWRDGQEVRTELTRNQVEVRCGGLLTQQGFEWRVRFSLAWSALGVTSPGDQRVGVMIYRAVPKRPVTGAAEMGSRGGQP
jgi:hypothetical protein